MKAPDIATERAGSKAKLQSLLDADFREELDGGDCASFVSVMVRQPRQRWASIAPSCNAT